MAEWLNTLARGLAIAVVAWAVARPRLFDAAWRGRIWGAALVGVAVLTLMTAVDYDFASPLPRGDAGHGAIVAGQGDGAMAGHGGPSAAGHGRPALLTVPAIGVPARLLFAVWAAVVLARLLFLSLAIVRIRAARAASCPLPASRLASLPQWTAANGQRFALVVSGRVEVPSMLGFGRPMIAVPGGWPERFASEALDAVLVHELAHAERRDDLFALAQQLVLAACWFHPAAWWSVRRMAFEREAACDELAARLTTTRRYARSLVAVAEAMRGRGAAPSVLVASSAVHRRQLSGRVHALLALDARPRLARASWLAGPAVAAVVAVAAVLPALPPVFDAAAADERRVTAEERPLAATASEPRAITGQARRERPPTVRTEPRRAAMVVVEPAAEGLTATAGAQVGRTDAAPAVPDPTLSSRELRADVVPSARPAAGNERNVFEKPTGVSAPFAALGSALSHAGTGTGRWFSRAGTSVASAVISR